MILYFSHTLTLVFREDRRRFFGAGDEASTTDGDCVIMAIEDAVSSSFEALDGDDAASVINVEQSLSCSSIS